MKIRSTEMLPVLVVGGSVIVLALTICFVSLVIAAFIVNRDGLSFFGAAISIPLPLVLARRQYLGTFRRDETSASLVAAILLVPGSLVLILSVRAWVDVILGNPDAIQYHDGAVLLLAIGSCAVGIGWLNLLWSKRLHAFAAPVPKRSPIRPFLWRKWLLSCLELPWQRQTIDTSSQGEAVVRLSRRERLMAVGCVAAITAGLVIYYPLPAAENVTRDKVPFRLPPNATDVSYCNGYNEMAAFEFTIDEPAFMEWVRNGVGFPVVGTPEEFLKPISTPVEMQRCYGMNWRLVGPSSVTIANGWYFRWRSADDGVYAAFDRNTNRAYYSRHFH
ncbi:MAG: hypothetical protein O2931_07575 [Planctomycetota bacterium]|nr:hypothetical protein [Planctomycetota bacterium]MDA1178640.1 hypothetical protein [Planctomycetota bacterium]